MTESEKQHHEAVDIINRALRTMAERAESLSKEIASVRDGCSALVTVIDCATDSDECLDYLRRELTRISDRGGEQPRGTLETPRSDDQMLA